MKANDIDIKSNDIRTSSTNQFARIMVQRGYTFFSSVLLHSSWNETDPRHVPKDTEAWSHSMFLTVKNTALILRVSLNFKEGTGITKGEDRIQLSFRLIATAKPIMQMSALAERQKLPVQNLIDVPFWPPVGQPAIPRFVETGAPEGLVVRTRVNHLTNDSWTVAIAGVKESHVVDTFDVRVAANALADWIDPMLPYTADGKLAIPQHSEITRDTIFVGAEALMRDRLNKRYLQEIATFGKYL